MAKQGCGAPVPGEWRLSDEELRAAIASLEEERETLEARCCVVRRRLALLRAERLARVRGAHFDQDAAAAALLRRLLQTGPRGR